MKIVLYPHPSLRHRAQPLTSIDKQVRLEVGQMFELMHEARGLGLAATQVALPYQLLVMNLKAIDPDHPDGDEAYFNPVILERKGTVEEEEGCLSLPGLYQKVRRAKTVKVLAYNLKGEPVEKVVNSLEARVWQHEIDHLHGILFIDRMGPIAKMASRGSLEDFERKYREAQERGETPPEPDIE